MKESACRFVSFEFAGVWFDQLGTALFITVDAGSVFSSGREGFQTRGLHSLCLDQSLRDLGVHRAPRAARLARGETDLIAVVVDALANAINPAKAERFLDRLGPRDARLA